MYISRVRLSNIKGFHNAREVDLTLTRPDGSHAGWTVLAGRNGSGKTTLLQAIALAIHGPAVARGLITDFDRWISARKNIAVAAVELMSTRHVDEFTDDDGLTFGYMWADSLWADLTWDIVRDRVRLLYPDEDKHKLAYGGPWYPTATSWFCAAYGSFRRLFGSSTDAQRLMSSPSPVSRLVTLFREDASLAEGVDWLIKQHLRSFEKRPGAEQLKNTALRVLGDGLLPDGYRIERVDSEGLWVSHRGNEFPLREMSDGYRTVAALTLDLIKKIYGAYGKLSNDFSGEHPAITAPGVVLIDEVDAHLHVSWQKRIGGWLKAHFPNIQFIVTTHSPYICQAADQGGLIRLPGPDENVPPQVVDQDLYQRVVYGSGDDAALSDLFELDTPYSERAQELRRELVRLETAVLQGRASEQEKQRYQQLQDQLTSSPVARVEEAAARLLGLTEPGRE